LRWWVRWLLAERPVWSVAVVVWIRAAGVDPYSRAYSVVMSQRTDVGMSADLDLVEIEPGTEDDLPGIVEILNYTIANSSATFATRPTSVGEQREWFEQFSSTGPYRLLVARRGRQVLGYVCSQRYRDHEAFRETVEVSIALLGYALLQVNPSAAYAYLGDAQADARNDTILTITEPGLHCSPAQQRHGPVHGSGFYALQYPQSAAAPSQPDVRAALTDQPTPTLIFKGSCDYLSWQSAQDYRRVLPNSSLVYLEGAGHNTYQDRPAEVMSAIRAFLTGDPLPMAPYAANTPPPTYHGPA